MATAEGEQNDDSCPAVDVQESCSKDEIHELYMLLNSMSANLDQLGENCCSVNDRINQLEMECIDLLQPIGDIISLERELKRLSEIETNYMNILKNIEKNEKCGKNENNENNEDNEYNEDNKNNEDKENNKNNQNDIKSQEHI